MAQMNMQTSNAGGLPNTTFKFFFSVRISFSVPYMLLTKET